MWKQTGWSHERIMEEIWVKVGHGFESASQCCVESTRPLTYSLTRSTFSLSNHSHFGHARYPGIFDVTNMRTVILSISTKIKRKHCPAHKVQVPLQRQTLKLLPHLGLKFVETHILARKML